MSSAPRFVRVRVPATTANLGPGFDCLGLALDLWNEAELILEGEGLHLYCEGEGQHLPVDDRNLIVQAIRFFCDTRGLPFPRGLTIRCKNHIPVSSGLGSSAAAALLGLLGAAALLDQPMDCAEALTLSARMEGHADNAAAALMGGLVIVAAGKGGAWLTQAIRIPDREVAVVLPSFNLPTHAARAALPGEIAMKDVTYNLGRAMLVVEALRNGDLNLLSQAMDDRLHLPYRLPLIPGGQNALAAALEAGANAVTISGAGPSLIAFTAGDPGSVGNAMAAQFQNAGVEPRVFLLKTSAIGATVHCEG
jgi:homoserine kinase